MRDKIAIGAGSAALGAAVVAVPSFQGWVDKVGTEGTLLNIVLLGFLVAVSAIGITIFFRQNARHDELSRAFADICTEHARTTAANTSALNTLNSNLAILIGERIAHASEEHDAGQ